MSKLQELETIVADLERGAAYYEPQQFLEKSLAVIKMALDAAAEQAEKADRQARDAINKASRLEGELGRARLDLKKLRKATVPDGAVVITGLEDEAAIVVFRPFGGDQKLALIEALKPYLMASNDTELQPDTDPRQAYYSPGAAGKGWPNYDSSVAIALAEPDADESVAKAAPTATLGDAVRALIKRGNRTGYRRLI